MMTCYRLERKVRPDSSMNQFQIIFFRMHPAIKLNGFTSRHLRLIKSHEAGYDVVMTGCIFAQACNHLDIDFYSHSVLMKEEKLQKYINLLYLSWTCGDINYNRIFSIQDFQNPTPKDFVSKYCHDLGFPCKLKATEIKGSLCKVVGLTTGTSVDHLDKIDVFVQFSKFELVSNFLELKAIIEKKNDANYVFHLSMI
ncbi:hypothetical protein Ccrd_015897 [Cynara cardunculus var. scolymus]|uniref:Uncharacterized protein n=1 Tax=Cynara cardunculus var. scolymus TaxID=59895 RepID=A0A103YAY0_CYNCS|nr:hypothetical protein Ccrd_015897 [Cynara cardunculus var. scolymus]